MGFIEICKASSTKNPVHGSFTFTAVNGTFDTGPLTVPVGACTGPIQIPEGTVTVTDEATPETGVISITADRIDLSTGGLINELVPASTNLADRTAKVTVVEGSLNSETLVTITNALIPTGVLEVCKAATPVGSLANQIFSFRISGLPETFTAPVGACTGPIRVQAGSVKITELAHVGSTLKSVSALSLNKYGQAVNELVSQNDAAGWAIVTVNSGPTATETIATFTNTPATGQLKICKIAGPNVAVDALFQITAGVTTYEVPAGPASEGGFCVVDGTFPVGSRVTVAEKIPAGGKVSAIKVTSSASGSVTNPAKGTAIVVIGTGFTEIAFTNTTDLVPPTGELKICKIAGPGITVGTNFTITANGKSYSVPAGPASEGGYCVLDGTFNVGTVVSVAEAVPASAHVSSISVSSSRGGSTTNTAAGKASVVIGTGFTEVTFTNVPCSRH